MGNRSNKYGIILMTLISALLFCSFIVMTSLSPLADSSPNANKFGTQGMWGAIGMILICYMLPLIIYMIGINAMRFIMAILCGFGLLINVMAIGTILIIGIVQNIVPDLLYVVGICTASVIANIIWFFIAFRSTKKHSAVLSN